MITRVGFRYGFHYTWGTFCQDSSEAFQGVQGTRAFEPYFVKANLPADYCKFQSYFHIARHFRTLFGSFRV